jgi:hypothetical protein
VFKRRLSRALLVVGDCGNLLVFSGTMLVARDKATIASVERALLSKAHAASS